jgi:hypothetical protein
LVTERPFVQISDVSGFQVFGIRILTVLCETFALSHFLFYFVFVFVLFSGFVVLSDALVELVPDLVWYIPDTPHHPSLSKAQENLVFENVQIPRFTEKFRGTPNKVLDQISNLEEESSVVWTAVTVAIIHFLFEIFR